MYPTVILAGSVRSPYGENGGYVYINQNTAPSGWSTLKRYQGYNHLIAINGYLTTKSGSVGADATKIDY
ncbi:hypothetical protein BK726_09695 [Bacillus thuringiensis serovar londrina]|uniref:Uncharacterized protein n=1 Tax=Bacillus thuringiensis TaxID=1428 RepID=A0A1B2RBW1_BACTU|nr:hypothetical protein [Bacillus thuringiensis]AOB42102.1 hypothetical protein pFR260_005c [Bacillus thuringiensis]OMH23713.1 hypothetical protein BUM91_31540 [Bacillus thuringiensis]OTX91810.1 hypothetical protein BK726_09695 [Bacillus thuringiensis serovar londrina]